MGSYMNFFSYFWELAFVNQTTENTQKTVHQEWCCCLMKPGEIFSIEFETDLIFEISSKMSFLEKVISSMQNKLFEVFGTPSADSSRLKTDAK